VRCTVTDRELEQAVALLKKGGLIAFPTESWYGLAADPFNERALDRLYAVKRRAADKPILVLVENIDQLSQLTSEIPPPYPVLMETFWPGPLSLVFPASSRVPQRLTAGTGTVAVRCSSNAFAARLVARFGSPITATSANISATRPHKTAEAVAGNLHEGVDMILDGGTTPGGKGSTIVAYRQHSLVCLREGQIPFVEVQLAQS
jgi:L-threonylcarbamoyladenylate synthase